MPLGGALSRGPSIDAECRQIESGATRRQKICLRLSERAGELEAVSRARARHEHLRVVGVKIDDEIVIRRVGEDANAALAYCGIRQSG